MLIVAGHLEVDPAQRDAYVAGCTEVVRLAREAPGCLDFAIATDVLVPGRVSIYERWEDERSLLAFRGGGPPDDQLPAILDAEVRRYSISAVGDA